MDTLVTPSKTVSRLVSEILEIFKREKLTLLEGNTILSYLKNISLKEDVVIQELRTEHDVKLILQQLEEGVK